MGDGLWVMSFGFWGNKKSQENNNRLLVKAKLKKQELILYFTFLDIDNTEIIKF